MEGKLLKTRTNRLLVNPVNGKYKMKPDKNYFRLKFVGEGTGIFHIDLFLFLLYSLDCNNWYTLNNTGGTDFTVSKGTVIFIRCIRNCHRLLSAVNNSTGYSSTYKFFTDTDSIDYIAEGNVASLLYTDFEGKTLVPPVNSGNNGYRGLYNLFYNCKHLVYAYDLILPFTDLVDYVKDGDVNFYQYNYGYRNMFYGCSNLTHAPKELPATVIPTLGYNSMFYGCSKLIHAPKEIPVISVPYEGFSMMFYECSSLVTAPHLKFKYLYNSASSGSCCFLMFYGCSKLKNVQKELYPTTVYYRSYAYMFYGCKSLVNAPKLPATTLDNYCYSYMFYNCSSLKNVQHVLSATILKEGCYSRMFYGCSSLERGPSLYYVEEYAIDCFNSMFYNCSSLKYLGSAGLENVLRLGVWSVELKTRCCNAMFYQCTSLERAPILSAAAESLPSQCYLSMFYGSSNLNYVHTRQLTAPNTAHQAWLTGVSKTGTFVMSSKATWSTTSAYVPLGWTIVKLSVE